MPKSDKFAYVQKEAALLERQLTQSDAVCPKELVFFDFDVFGIRSSCDWGEFYKNTNKKSSEPTPSTALLYKFSQTSSRPIFVTKVNNWKSEANLSQNTDTLFHTPKSFSSDISQCCD